MLVESLPRRGFYVKQLSLKELVDLYDVRLRLEPLGAKQAAESSDPQLRKDCQSLLSLYLSKTFDDSSINFKEMDYTFHNLIMKMSGNLFLQKMISSFNIISLGNLQLFMDKKEFPKKTAVSLKEHTLILKAVIDKKPDKAEEAMHCHIEETRNLISLNMEKDTHGEVEKR